ncbi:nucleotidyltransferase family protein [Methanobacterium spitsbergense]|uniref:Nucleotidyltransferase family protein n=1 Tax=Methanobacterium spitsbergense TaxID=2874285 RepID=A0A8T5UWP3_9EURY|nr:nucleotidyltransferase family protein [Methanobacterium spitsbergense]MBZ2166316.1 nucleotidyltransferase family protein [Methanobacterium spitsbergense]
MENDKNLKLSSEDELLICCSNTWIDPETMSKIVSLVSEDLDWNYIIQLASRHRLKPLLYRNINLICPDMVPENVLCELKEYFNANVRKNLLMTGELIKILELLKAYGIDAIPYKGPSLALLAYENLALREFNDLDIFIFKKDVLKTKKLMKSNKYSLYFLNDPKPESHYINTQREYKFINDINGIMVEMHWRFQGISDNFIDQKSLKNIEINRRNTLRFSNEDLLLILCTHSANHNWISLSWISDIAQFIQNQNINWPYVLDKANTYEIKKILCINLYLVKYLFNIKIPQDILERLSYEYSVKDISLNIIKQIFEQHDINLAKEALIQFRIRDNWINGIKFCLWRAFSPTSLEWDTLQLPEILYPLYYIYRPIRLLIYGARFKPKE